MDIKQEKIEIPKVIYQGEDKKLKERVTKFKAGTFRIVLFTLVGLFMGWHSHTYVGDNFFPTKLITAIPYKISETIYVFLLGTDAAELFEGGRYYGWITEFFPHSMLATWLAETLTTMLIGAAIYGALAYFTGDKRVFTLQRFLKFAGCWCGVILLVIVGAYGVNAKAKADNEALKGEPQFFLYSLSGSGSGTGRGELNEMLQAQFFSELVPMELVRDRDGEVPLGIYYDENMRFGLYRVNYEKQYLVTEEGRTYHISQGFAKVIEDFAEEKILPEVSGSAELSR